MRLVQTTSRLIGLVRRLVLCAAFVAWPAVQAAVQAGAPAAEARHGARAMRVFVLHSYAPGSNRTDGLAEGIGDVLAKSRLNVQQSLEYLDASRLGRSPLYPRILEAKRQELALRLEAAPPDVVILTDRQAMEFWAAHSASLAPGVPVTYCGVGDTVPESLLRLGRVTGVVERPGFGATAKVALALAPGADKLLVLGARAMLFDAVRTMLEADLAALSPHVGVEYFPELDIAAIEQRLRTLDPGWLVLVVGRPEENGRPMPSSEAAGRVCGVSPVPVFAVWNSWMGHGPVGGKIIVPEEQGAAAGRQAVDILQGGDPGRMPPLVEASGAFMFDYQALSRFGLSEAALPPGSRLLNRPESFYESNKPLVWGYGLVMVLLFAVSGVLGLYVGYRRRMQARLAAQVGFVQSLMESMPLPVFYKDVSGVYQGCNQAFEAFLNLKRERVVGKTVYDLVPKGLAEGFEAKDRALLSGGPTQEYEQDMNTSAGLRRVVFNKALYYDTLGRPAGLVGVITDITPHREAEEALERARNYLQSIIDSSPSAMLCVDRAGVITHTNDRTSSFCDAIRQGCTLDAHPRLAELSQDIRAAIDEGKPRHLAKRAYRLDGELRFEDVVIYPISAMGLSEAVVRIEDATERTRMEEMLVQTEKMMSVGGLAAGMAHEINNPLGGIMQSLQVVQNRLRPGLAANQAAAAQAGCTVEGVQKYLELRDISAMLEAARSSAQRAAGIVSNMLEFSRRSTSAWLLEDINALVEKTLALCLQDYDLSNRYDFRKVAVVRQLDPASPAAPCSAQQMQQVILNLMRNAAQALLAGGGDREPTITVRTQGKADSVVIEIEDNGPGMDATAQRKIFEPFYTTKAPGQGTGLGLSISYFIVTENHGGRISVASEPGKGARFTVELPKKSARLR